VEPATIGEYRCGVEEAGRLNMADYHVAVDIGGTFTDIVLQDTRVGTLWTAKVPTTPADPAGGFLAGVQQVLADASAGVAEVRRVFHGTTIATNAIIQRTPAKIGLITTKGFKFVLEIGRHSVPRTSNMYGWIKPERPVTPDLIFEVEERVDLKGEVVKSLDVEECRAVAHRLRGGGVEAVAVCLLYSYANPEHERAIGEVLASELPGVHVSLSSDVLPQFREFERSVATSLNAYVMPRVSRYLASLEQSLDKQGIAAPLFIMKSNGGVTTARDASVRAITTVLSGPAAGVLGALEVARAIGMPNFISVDVGGTSADISLVRDGQPEVTLNQEIGGLPLQTPMLDIVTIGAGGGSIARITGMGGLAVGPESAGSDPGPVCYGRGGTRPTVTDANVVLGRLPAELGGGTVRLDVDAARRAIETTVAGDLGSSAEDAAAAIVEVIENNMAAAIRTVSIGRGHDPKEFGLIAFGGAGPLHACTLASLLGVRTVVVPPSPGVLSTYGLLFTDLRNDYVQTFTGDVDQLDGTKMAQTYAPLEDQARQWLRDQGIGDAEMQIIRSADLRYRNQGFELTVPVPSGQLSPDAVSQAIEAFHDLHRRLYTYEMRDMPVQLVNLRVTAIGRLPSPKPGELEAGDATPAPVANRWVTFQRGTPAIHTPLYRREQLRPGAKLEGPAIVEQPDTTTLVWPGFSASVDGLGNIIIEASQGR
jgi:N-methylhydantoinase A